MPRMSTGPKDPYSLVGGPIEIGRTEWGAVAQCCEYEDGWLYQISVPRYEALAFWPRPALASIIFRGKWIDTWHEGATNYLGVWVERSLHEDILPDGPLPHQIFRREDMDEETARRSYTKWREERSTSLSGPFQALERVQELAKEEDQEGD